MPANEDGRLRGLLAEAPVRDLGSAPSDGAGDATKGHRRFRLMALPVIVTALTLFVVGCVILVMSAVASSSSSAAVTGQSSDSVLPRVNIDYQGLSGAFDSPSDGSIGKKEREWQDRLIYYHRARKGEQCWPIPYGNKTYNMLCYDGALTLCMILTFRDYTMTIDTLYDEIVAKYGEEEATAHGHDMDNGKRTIWPSTLMRYYQEERGLKWNVFKDDPDTIDKVREALLADHPVVCGAGGYPMDFYLEDGRTYTCPNGHTIMFYKYEDGIFWAKDTGEGGPMVAYPESGGKIDLRSWFARASGSYIGVIEFYTDERPSPKFPSMSQDLLADGDRKGKVPSMGAEASESPATVLSEEGTSTMGDDGSDDMRERISGICGGIPPSGSSDSSIWVAAVLGEMGADAIPGLGAREHYDMFCKSEAPYCGGTTETDPDCVSMRPGMVVAVAHVPSPDVDERMGGHCGIYVGDGMVMHDRGGSVEAIPMASFVSEYGGVAPVGWGWAYGLIPGEPGEGVGTGEGPARNPAGQGIAFDGASPIVQSHGYEESHIRDAVLGYLADSYPNLSTGRVHLMGGYDDQGGTARVSYLVTAESGKDIGLTLLMREGEGLIVMESERLIADSTLLYDVGEQEYVPIGETPGASDAVASDGWSGDFNDMTAEEYLRPFLDEASAIPQNEKAF